MTGSPDRDSLIVRYFELGFSYKEIIAFLSAYHSIRISLRYRKRILSSKRCYRRKNHSNIREVVDAVERELDGSGGEVGYRHMHRRLLTKHKLVASRETVRKTIAALDPEGVSQRLMRRFRCCVYSVRGPNEMWHIDGRIQQVKTLWICYTWCNRWIQQANSVAACGAIE
jgi:hypothetical protein